MVLPYSLDEPLILLDAPVNEAGRRHLAESLPIFLSHRLVVLLRVVDLLGELLQLFKVVEKLELIEFRDLEAGLSLWLGFKVFVTFIFLLALLGGIGVIHLGLIEGIVEEGCLAALAPKGELLVLGLNQLILMLLYDLIHLLPLLPIVLLLKQQHVRLLHLEIEGVTQLFSLLSRLLLQLSELPLPLLNNLVYIH